MTTLYDFDAQTIDGVSRRLDDYRDQVVLVVNVASRCGYTPQYSALEQLYVTFREQGFTVLGFPCNQFGDQEPGTDAEIKEFCSLTYDVDFPMFAKVDVNGSDAHPLFQWLTSEQSGLLGKRIKWNFTKFLVNRDGAVVKRYGSTTKPEQITDDIEALLG